MKKLIFALALSMPAIAFAQSAVVTTSKVFAVKQVTDAKGVKKNELIAPDKVLPGTPLVFMLDYVNNGTAPVTKFNINNPIPANVLFTGVEQTWAAMSVDGGKTFGALAALKVPGTDGKLRAAQTNDVTAIRWTLAQPLLPKAKGRVMFYGVVK